MEKEEKGDSVFRDVAKSFCISFTFGADPALGFAIDGTRRNVETIGRDKKVFPDWIGGDSIGGSRRKT